MGELPCCNGAFLTHQVNRKAIKNGLASQRGPSQRRDDHSYLSPPIRCKTGTVLQMWNLKTTASYNMLIGSRKGRDAKSSSPATAASVEESPAVSELTRSQINRKSSFLSLQLLHKKCIPAGRWNKEAICQ